MPGDRIETNPTDINLLAPEGKTCGTPEYNANCANNDKVSCFKISENNKEILMISVHGPSGKQEAKDVISLLETLAKEQLQDGQTYDAIIVAGDFNCPLVCDASKGQEFIKRCDQNRQNIQQSLAVFKKFLKNTPESSGEASQLHTTYSLPEEYINSQRCDDLTNSQVLKTPQSGYDVIASFAISNEPITLTGSQKTQVPEGKKFEYSIEEKSVNTSTDHAFLYTELSFGNAKNSPSFPFLIANLIPTQGWAGLKPGLIDSKRLFESKTGGSLEENLFGELIEQSVKLLIDIKLLEKIEKKTKPRSAALLDSFINALQPPVEEKQDLMEFSSADRTEYLMALRNTPADINPMDFSHAFKIKEFFQNLLDSKAYQDIVAQIDQSKRAEILLEKNGKWWTIPPYSNQNQNLEYRKKIIDAFFENAIVSSGRGAKPIHLNNLVNDFLSSLGLQQGAGYPISQNLSEQLFQVEGEKSPEFKEICFQVAKMQHKEIVDFLQQKDKSLKKVYGVFVETKSYPFTELKMNLAGNQAEVKTPVPVQFSTSLGQQKKAPPIRPH